MKKKKVSFATREGLVSRLVTIREFEVQRDTPGGSSEEAQAGAAGELAGVPGGPGCTRSACAAGWSSTLSLAQ